MISYRIRTILCDGTQNNAAPWVDLPIVEQGTDIPDVGVLYLSPILRADGANEGAATVKLGDTAKDAIPLYLLGQNFHITPADNTGVFFNCPVLAAGTKVILLIGYEVFGSTPN